MFRRLRSVVPWVHAVFERRHIHPGRPCAKPRVEFLEDRLAPAVTASSGTPTGTVSFYDGSTLLGTGTVSAGVATYSTSSLTIETHTITATYSGDTNFSSSTTNAQLPVVGSIDGFALNFSNNGSGLSGVTVNLLENLGDFSASTTTDSSGEFDFAGVAGGSYKVQFIAPFGATFDGGLATTSGSTGTTSVLNLNQDVTGVDVGFLFNGSDGSGGSGGMSPSPVAADATLSVFHDSSIPSIDLSQDVSGGDGNPLQVSIVSEPTHGTLTLNDDGTYQYTPDPHWVGQDSFTFQASDGSTNSNTATITINVVNGVFIWTGAGSDDLASDPLNWSNNAAPIAGDVVLFNGTSSKDANFDSSFTSTLTTLEINAGYTGQITLQQDLTISTLLSQSAGEVDGPGNLNIAGTANWSGGSWDSGTAEIANGATLNISPTSSVNLTAETLNDDGVINWTQGDVENSDTTANVEADGVMNISSSGTWADALGDGGSSINIAGTMNSTDNGSGQPVTVAIAFNLSGTANVNSGSLHLNGGGSYSGTYEIAAAADVTLGQGDFTALQGGQAVGQGQYIIGSGGTATETVEQGTVTTAENVSLVTGGAIDGPGTFVVDGGLQWSGGAMNGTGTTQIAADASAMITATVAIDSRTLQNLGQISWTGGNIRMSGGSIVNLGGFTISGGGNISRNAFLLPGIASIFQNSGTLTKLKTNTSTIRANLLNTVNGVVQVQAGSLVLVGVNNTYNGGFDIQAGASIEFTNGGIPSIHNFGASASFNPAGTGDVYFGGGSCDVNLANNLVLTISSLTVQGGTVSGGTIEAGFLDWQAGTMQSGVTEISAGGYMSIGTGSSCTLNNYVIDNQGSIDWVNNNLFVLGTSAVVNDGSESQGTFNAFSGGMISDVDQGISAETLFSLVNGAVLNDCSAGTPIMEIAVSNNASTVNLGGGQFTFAYSYSVQDGVSSLAGGALQVGAAFSQSGDSETTLGGGQLSCNSLLVAGGYFSMQGGSVTVDGGSGTAAVAADALITGAGQISGNLINSGSISPGAGTFTVQGDYTQTAGGALAITIAGANAGSYSNLSVTGDASISGTLSVSLQGYAPNPGVDTFQILTPGGQLTAGYTISTVGDAANFTWATEQSQNNVILTVQQ